MAKTYSIESGALVNYRFAMWDVKLLLEMSSEGDGKKGRPSRDYEGFKRAAVILGITAWETFIEDTIRGVALGRLDEAKAPTELLATFNAVASGWLESRPKNPEDVLRWTGNGWKEMIRRRLIDELDALNTPNSENIRRLSSRYLGTDITKTWKWRNSPPERSIKRLDELIVLRGALVHRGPEMLGNAAVRKEHVIMLIAVLDNLVACTERSLGTAPTEHVVEVG